jgi:hypothetical protein
MLKQNEEKEVESMGKATKELEREGEKRKQGKIKKENY